MPVAEGNDRDRPRPTPELCVQAYTACLEGLALWQIADCRESAQTIGHSPYPLAQRVLDTAVFLEGKINTCPAEDFRTDLEVLTERHMLFRHCVRSYVFSGLPVHKEAVLTTAGLIRVDRRQLHDIVFPDNLITELELRPNCPGERLRQLRGYGRTAMLSLDLAGPVVRLRAWWDHQSWWRPQA